MPWLRSAVVSRTKRPSENAWLMKRSDLERLPKTRLRSHAQELLLRRARQAETASRVNEWVSSPGLQPPKGLGELFSNQK